MNRLLATTALALTVGTAAAAQDCDSVTFSDVGWTDITATTAAASVVLDALGYETETKILYGDASGKKTDLLLQIDGRKIGVSVTRAYHYPPTTLFTVAEARSLLEKKLADLPLSQSNALPADAWVRSMLHVLVYDAQYGDAIQDAWDNEIDAQLKGDAILFITVTNGDDSFIY